MERISAKHQEDEKEIALAGLSDGDRQLLDSYIISPDYYEYIRPLAPEERDLLFQALADCRQDAHKVDVPLLTIKAGGVYVPTIVTVHRF